MGKSFEELGFNINLVDMVNEAIQRFQLHSLEWHFIHPFGYEVEVERLDTSGKMFVGKASADQFEDAIEDALKDWLKKAGPHQNVIDEMKKGKVEGLPEWYKNKYPSRYEIVTFPPVAFETQVPPASLASLKIERTISRPGWISRFWSWLKRLFGR